MYASGISAYSLNNIPRKIIKSLIPACSPVKWVVNIWEDVKKMDRVEFAKIVPNGVHTGEYDV